jgi:hypothetical protein
LSLVLSLVSVSVLDSEPPVEVSTVVDVSDVVVVVLPSLELAGLEQAAVPSSAKLANANVATRIPNVSSSRSRTTPQNGQVGSE